MAHSSPTPSDATVTPLAAHAPIGAEYSDDTETPFIPIYLGSEGEVNDEPGDWFTAVTKADLKYQSSNSNAGGDDDAASDGSTDSVLPAEPTLSIDFSGFGAEKNYTRLIFMPPRYAKNKELTGTKLADPNVKPNDWVQVRASLYYEVSDLHPKQLKNFSARHWITPASAESLARFAEGTDPDATPDAVFSDSDTVKALSFGGVTFKSKKFDGIDTTWSKNIAKVRYHIARVWSDMPTSFPKELNEDFWASTSKRFVQVQGAVHSSPWAAKAAVKFLMKYSGVVRKKSKASTAILFACFMQAICASRNPKVTLLTYKKVTLKMRTHYFGSDAEKVWDDYYSTVTGKKPKLFDARRIAEGVSFAKAAAQTVKETVGASSSAIIKEARSASASILAKTEATSSRSGKAKIAAIATFDKGKQYLFKAGSAVKQASVKTKDVTVNAAATVLATGVAAYGVYKPTNFVSSGVMWLEKVFNYDSSTATDGSQPWYISVPKVVSLSVVAIIALPLNLIESGIRKISSWLKFW